MAHPVGSVPAPPRPRMTFEEFLRSPYQRAEWVDGEVFELSPENIDHVGVAGFLHHLLAEFVEQRGLGRVMQGFLMKTGSHLAGRVPDILFLATGHEGCLRRNYVDGPADLAVEVVSPDSVSRDREVKRREYQEGGVPEFWLIDPLANRATFLFLEDGAYRPLPVGPDGAVHSRVLPGLWIRPEWLLQEPRPRLAVVRRAWGLE
jgi:Uma2 family endonuclease